MKFNYYYGTEAEQYSFYCIPKYLITADEYAGLSVQAKLLYGLLLDRMSMSIRNKWIDDENKIYVIYQISEIQEDLKISRRKAIECLHELEECGLVRKKTRGLGLPSLLYLKNFLSAQSA